MLRSAAFTSSVVASIPIVLPCTKSAVLRIQVNTARCVSSAIRRRVREIVEWSGDAWSSPMPRKSRNANESAARQAMPRSESMPSNSRSKAAGNRCPGAGRADPSSRRKRRCTALQRNRRSRARAAADSAADKTDGWRPSASPSSEPTSSVVDCVCACPSPWAKCSTRCRACRSLNTGC